MNKQQWKEMRRHYKASFTGGPDGNEQNDNAQKYFKDFKCGYKSHCVTDNPYRRSLLTMWNDSKRWKASVEKRRAWIREQIKSNARWW